MSLKSVVANLTRLRITIVLIILGFLPIFYPLMLPMRVSPLTQDFYDRLMAVPEGGKVYWGWQLTDISQYVSEKYDMTVLLSLMAVRHLKIIFIPLDLCIPAAAEDLVVMAGLEKKYGYVYGKDYVILPFISGDESAMAAVAANIKATVSVDNRGTPLTKLPLMNEVNKITDVDLCYIHHASVTFGPMFVRQWPAAYGVTTITGSRYSGIAQWYGKYILGCLDATLGWAEFEKMVGMPAEAITKMDSRNLMCLFFFSIVALGVASFQLEKRRGKAHVQEAMKR